MDIFSNNLLEILIKGETEYSGQQELKIYLLYCQVILDMNDMT